MLYLFFILGGPKTIQLAQFGIPSMYREQNIKEYDSVCWKANLSHLELRKRHINLSTASQPVRRLFPSYLLQRSQLQHPATQRPKIHLPLCELKTKISYLILSRKSKFCELIVPLSLPFCSLWWLLEFPPAPMSMHLKGCLFWFYFVISYDNA